MHELDCAHDKHQDQGREDQRFGHPSILSLAFSLVMSAILPAHITAMMTALIVQPAIEPQRTPSQNMGLLYARSVVQSACRARAPADRSRHWCVAPRPSRHCRV